MRISEVGGKCNALGRCQFIDYFIECNSFLVSTSMKVLQGIAHGQRCSRIAFYLRCRAHSASEPNLDKWTPEDIAAARRLVGVYKQIRDVVQQGAAVQTGVTTQ